jgi:SAM-dependent methyltransferase
MPVHKEIVKKRYNSWERGYDERLRGRLAGFRAMYKRAQDILERNGSLQEKTLLDIGCGTGKFLMGLAMKNSDSRFFGIDIAENMVENARQISQEYHINNLEFKLGDSANLDFEDNFFDYVTSLISFHYWDHDKAISEIKRVLKPEGKILIADHKIGITGRGANKIYSKRQLRELFEKKGFIDVKHHIPATSRLYGLIPTCIGITSLTLGNIFDSYFGYFGICPLSIGLASLFPIIQNQMITARVKK